MARLGDLCEIFAGQGAPQGDNNYCDRSYGVPFIKAGDLSDLLSGKSENKLQCVNDEVAKSHKLKLYPSGSILFAKSGMSCMKGYIYRTQYPCYVVSHLAIVIPEKVDGEYLKFYFQYNKPNFLIKDAAYPSISLQDISNIELQLPNIEEQEAIAASLNKVSELIFLRKQQLSKLDELVKSRFIEMFGDVITNSKSWKQYIFSEIATSRLGKMLDAKQQTGESSFPYLANFNVQWFRFDLTSLNQMDFDEEDRVEFELKEGDLLVCEGGEIGRCAVWHNEMQPCYFQKALHRVRCNTEVINPNYMAWWFKYNCDHNGFAAIEGAKATIAHLPGAKLKLLRVTTPPIELQNEFAAFIEQIDKSKFEIQKSLEKLETLKKALMQKYFG